MIQRKKLTIFMDAKDNTDIYEVKKMIEGLYFYQLNTYSLMILYY